LYEFERISTSVTIRPKRSTSANSHSSGHVILASADEAVIKISKPNLKSSSVIIPDHIMTVLFL
jgi:hypothetical protein